MKVTTILTGILIKLIFDNVQCELDTKPADAVIIAKKDSVIMKCSSNDVNDICENILWKHYKPNSRTGYVINTGNKLKAGFNSYVDFINTKTGNCNLIIYATPLAAGTYQCVDLSNGDKSSAELIIIDPDYRIKENVCECFAYYFGNRTHIMKWMESNGNDWTRVDSTISLGYQQYISFTNLTPNQLLMCSIKVSTFGKLYPYKWPKPAEGLSDANNESVSRNQGFSVAVVVGIAIGVAIVSALVTLLVVLLVEKTKK